MSGHLSDRKKRILKAVIDAHIQYGEPVGSKDLSQSDEFSCSPATIRNEMAELEEMGYLEQPHTSAGRVPSELGYRFYVDSLVKRYNMTTGEIEEIDRSLKRKLAEVDQILAEASKLASSFTNYSGIAVKSRSRRSVITHFESIYMDGQNFVLVMIFPDGSAKTRTMHITFPISSAELSHLTAVLNRRLTNITADEITYALTSEIERAVPAISSIVASVAHAIFETLSDHDSGDVQIDGVNNLLQYPEYSDTSSIKDLIGMFEHKDELLSLISGDESDDKVNVYIGKENSVGVMNNSALVYRTIKRNGRTVGAIGVIGPTRMDYSRVISTIERLATGIDNMLNPSEDDR